MKKIFLTPVVLFAAVLLVNCATYSAEYRDSVWACSQKTTGDITGGACSIAELNLENKRAGEDGKFFGFHPKGEKDLRPVPLQSISKKTGERCLFGTCLYKSLLGGK